MHDRPIRLVPYIPLHLSTPDGIGNTALISGSCCYVNMNCRTGGEEVERKSYSLRDLEEKSRGLQNAFVKNIRKLHLVVLYMEEKCSFFIQKRAKSI